jgi:hypothetical protein
MLRDAITQNDTDGGGDTIRLSDGTYYLSATLEIAHPVTIVPLNSAAHPVISVPAGTTGIVVDPASGPVTLQGLTVTGASGSTGAAIYATGATPLTLQDDVVRDNSSASTGLAAGLTFYGAQVVIDRSTFSNNRGHDAGAIRELNTAGDSLTIRDSELEGNTGIGNVSGGALMLGAGTLDVERTRVTGNGSSGGAGIRLRSVGALTATVSDSTFDGNSTGGAGGALLVDGGSGGTATTTLRSDTFVGDVAVSGGGVVAGPPASVTLQNSVLAKSSSGFAGTCAAGGPIVSHGHNVADDASCALAGPNDRQGVDPLLGPIANSGGPTLTALPLAGSPLVDAADGSACSATDQRSYSRPRGNACDIGAAESDFSAPVPPTDTTSTTPTTPTVPTTTPTTTIPHTTPTVVLPRTPPPAPAKIVLTKLKVARSVHGKRLVTWTASGAGSVRFAVERRKKRHWVAKARFTLRGGKGSNNRAFPAKLLRKLAAGSYRLTAVATGTPVHATFDIVPPKAKRR